MHNPQHNHPLRHLEQLNRIGIALSRERNTAKLLETILIAAKELLHADGGTLYRLEDGKRLRFEVLFNDSLGLAMGGASGAPIPFPPIELYDRESGEPNSGMVVTYAVLNDSTVVIDDAYAEQNFDFSGTQRFDERTGYRSRSFLTVPMKNHEEQIIGVFQLINAVDPVSGEVRSFSAADRQLAESLASQAAIALTNHQLMEQLKTLFESLIELINTAIDHKSPYTGAHCQRVPILTMMIAEAARHSERGALQQFRPSAEELYELKIAGLLHDCGKITTPVHVVDKATKLETIFDRIHLVDTRFEVLKRDAEIAYLKDKLAAVESGDLAALPALEQRLQKELAELDADREFVRRNNSGGEFMDTAAQHQIGHIAARRWVGVDGVECDFLSADEVRNLAKRVQASTDEITTMVSALQAGTRDAVDFMQESSFKADDCVQQAQEAGAALAEITSAVAQMRESNTQIAVAAEQQSQVAEEMNRAVVSIRDVTENTVQQTVDSATTSNQLATLAGELNRAIGQLKL